MAIRAATKRAAPAPKKPGTRAKAAAPTVDHDDYSDKYLREVLGRV